MSSSDANSKIDLLDTVEVVGRKVKKANAPPKQVEDNGLLAFTEHVLLPASALLDGERIFKVEQKEGEALVYHDIESMKKDYAADVVSWPGQNSLEVHG
jgi:tyrosyl-tRNA synthetase